jgi:hypothetical protein
VQPDPKGTLREHQPGHARPRPVTRPQPIPPSSGISLVDATRGCPSFPRRCSMVRRGSDGSSPSEGFTERPAKRLLELSQWETTVTRGHSRALPGVPSSGVSAGGIRLDQAHPNRLDPLCTTQGPAESARHIEMSGKGDPGVAHVQHGGDSFGENRWSVVGAQPKRRVRRERRARLGTLYFPITSSVAAAFCLTGQALERQRQTPRRPRRCPKNHA